MLPNGVDMQRPYLLADLTALAETYCMSNVRFTLVLSKEMHDELQVFRARKGHKTLTSYIITTLRDDMRKADTLAASKREEAPLEDLKQNTVKSMEEQLYAMGEETGRITQPLGRKFNTLKWVRKKRLNLVLSSYDDEEITRIMEKMKHYAFIDNLGTVGYNHEQYSFTRDDFALYERLARLSVERKKLKELLTKMKSSTSETASNSDSKQPSKEEAVIEDLTSKRAEDA